MNLDLRIPLGLLFTLTGAILTLFGLKTNGDAELYAKCLGINANLWWGLVLLAFGLITFVLGQRRGAAAGKGNHSQQSKKKKRERALRAANRDQGTGIKGPLLGS